jgi:hypothetical protein
MRATVSGLLWIGIIVGAAGACGGSTPMQVGTAGRDGGTGSVGDDAGGAFLVDGSGGTIIGADTGSRDSGGTCGTDADCGPGGLCDPMTHTCGCGGTQVTAQNVQPNLLIVLDRSCSMRALVGGTPKWTIATQALTSLVKGYAGRIRFGLELFPSRLATDRCVVGTIPIPVAANTEGAVESLLSASLATTDANYPSGPCVTPIDTAMTEAATDPALGDTSRSDFALLITDGEQAGCNAKNGNATTINEITTLHSRGVRTFVVGFGSSVSTASLDAFAQAGGAVNPSGPHKFYDASDLASLDAALSAIGQASLTCTLQLSGPPPNGDASLIFVYIDKTPPPVPRDPAHKNGWDYDAATEQVTFYGAACDELKSGNATSAEVVFGCPGNTTPPPPIH